MTEHVKGLIYNKGIELCSHIALSFDDILRPYKLQQAGFTDLSSLTAFMIAVPYLTECKRRNVSAYAISRDYHAFFSSLFEEIVPFLKKRYPQYHFAGFTDNSPIDERRVAAAAGLGIIGDNGMLITEKYSSYVFLGEIITNAPIESGDGKEIERCESCGRCKAACPMKETGQCLSSLTQKKGDLTEEEKQFIVKYGCAWGCDICQEVCPHTYSAKKSGTIYTNIPYFKEEILPYLTTDIIDRMSDGEFALRAYSWRKRETIRRNLSLLEDDGHR